MSARGLRFSEKDIGPYCRVRSSMPVSMKRPAIILGGSNSAAKQPLVAVKEPGESVWQRKIFDLLVEDGLSPVWELKNAIPGRRFRVDIAFPEVKVAIEIDGWQHHGKTLNAFKSDRQRQNLFVMHGWRVLRFFPGEISKTPDECIKMIRAAISLPI